MVSLNSTGAKISFLLDAFWLFGPWNFIMHLLLMKCFQCEFWWRYKKRADLEKAGAVHNIWDRFVSVSPKNSNCSEVGSDEQWFGYNFKTIDWLVISSSKKIGQKVPFYIPKSQNCLTFLVLFPRRARDKLIKFRGDISRPKQTNSHETVSKKIAQAELEIGPLTLVPLQWWDRIFRVPTLVEVF